MIDYVYVTLIGKLDPNGIFRLDRFVMSEKSFRNAISYPLYKGAYPVSYRRDCSGWERVYRVQDSKDCIQVIKAQVY